MPSSVVNIKCRAFSNSSIQTLIFTDDSRLETIGEFVFNNCQALQSIKIPPSVIEIANSAFSESTIEEVIFSNDSKFEVLTDFIFEKCQLLKSITIPASILKIGENAFSESVIEEIIFADDSISNLKTIGMFAFKHTNINKSIQIPVSIVEIEECAFAQSTLPEIIFAKESRLAGIDDAVFLNCRFLKSIKITDSIVTIGQKAFAGSGLEEILFSQHSQLAIIDKEAFLHCKSLKSFIFPKTLNEVRGSAFSYCNLPKSIKMLSRYVELLDDPFINSGVEEITFGNYKKWRIWKKSQTVKKKKVNEKHMHFLKLCREGDVSKCKAYAKLYVIKLSSAGDEGIDHALPIAIAAKNVELIKFLIKYRVSNYRNCTSLDIDYCFSDDDIIESVLFDNAFIFWFSLCAFVQKKADRLVSKLITMFRSKEFIKEWVRLFKTYNLPQSVSQGDSLDCYQFLLDYNLIELANIEAGIVRKHIYQASYLGNVQFLKKALEILDKKNISPHLRFF